jgi:hypothetical protein
MLALLIFIIDIDLDGDGQADQMHAHRPENGIDDPHLAPIQLLPSPTKLLNHPTISQSNTSKQQIIILRQQGTSPGICNRTGSGSCEDGFEKGGYFFVGL